MGVTMTARAFRATGAPFLKEIGRQAYLLFPVRAHLLTTAPLGQRWYGFQPPCALLEVSTGHFSRGADNAASRHCRCCWLCSFPLPFCFSAKQFANSRPAGRGRKTRDGGESEWRSTTWKQRSSAGAQGAPL